MTKDGLETGECLIQVDYSKGYHNKDQVRSNQPILFTKPSAFSSHVDIFAPTIPQTSLTCVSKVIECIEERLPLMTNLRPVFIWFRSRYVFFFCWRTSTQLNKLNRVIMRPITAKSGRIVVTSPEDFASHASKQVESVTTLYLPTKEILPEPATVSDAPYIKGTLDVHRIIRRKNIQGVMYLEFYRLSSDEVPFFTQYYRNDDDPIVCGHQSFNDGPNKCANCFSIYHQREEWIECPVCMQWYCSEPCFSV